MIGRLIAVFAATILAFSQLSAANAQGMSSRGGTGSGFGSSSFGSGFGSSGFGSSGFGGSGFGSSGFGGSGFGSSGFGGSGFGGSGFGNSGFGGSGFGSSGFGGSGFGSSGFGGNNSYGNNGQNFIGRSAASTANAFGQMNRASTQFFNNMNNAFAASRGGKKSASKSSSASETQSQAVRLEVHLADEMPRPATNQLATTIQPRLSKIFAVRHIAPPAITMEGDTAVVRGVAASEGDRALVSQLLAIEPSIHDVRNEMTVAAPAAKPAPATSAPATTAPAVAPHTGT